MKEYHSGSSLRQHRVKNLFVPPLLVWLLYALISLIILAFLNLNVFWQSVLGHPLTVSEVTTLSDRFLEFQDRLGTPIVMLFWLFIGAVTYTIIWLVENVLFIAKTEVEESKYIYRSPILQHQYWEITIKSNLFLFFIVLLWVSFIALYLRLLLPTFSHFFQSGFYDESIYQRFLGVIVAMIGNTLVIYLLMLLRRIITYSWSANRPI
jgi:hypothetical protein